ncbi:hypothetical protein F5Y18DRAFT_124213 [Xylariaceae sp. FL1019]|nr:hypothetical protein F5Y18DRAFT_124213 [Xylariaceae sp. FL1019]
MQSSTFETITPPAYRIPQPSSVSQTPAPPAQMIRNPKPMNNFMFWSQTMRPVLKAQNPGVPNGQISTMLSTIWEEIPPEEKAHQKALAQQANPEWARTHPIVDGKRTRTVKRKFSDDNHDGKRRKSH